MNTSKRPSRTGPSIAPRSVDGIDAPGAEEKIRLYDSYLRKVEHSLETARWLVEDRFSMADIAMTPYANRRAALSLEGPWANGRLPRVEAWFARIRERPTFEPTFVKDARRAGFGNAGEWHSILAYGRPAAADQLREMSIQNVGHWVDADVLRSIKFVRDRDLNSHPTPS